MKNPTLKHDLGGAKQKHCLNAHIPTLLKLWRSSGDGRPLLPVELNQVSKSLLELQRGLTGTRTLAGAGYMQNKGFLGAYLLYYWPVTYTQIKFSLDDFFAQDKNLFSKNELSILDVGSGPAPAAASLCDIIQNKNSDATINATLVDSSPKALELGCSILKNDFKNIHTQTLCCDFEKPSLNFEQKKFDIIVMSHALNELWKNDSNFLQKRIAFIKNILSCLQNDGILILNEPALLKTSRELIQLRNELVTQNVRVLYPCVQSSICPVIAAGENHTCHFEREWSAPQIVASIAQKAGLDRSSVKMSLFIFKRDFLEAKNLNTPNTNEEEKVYRVVSDAMLNKSGRVRYLICDGKSRIAFSAKKDDAYAKSQGFFNLKKYECIKIKKPELRGETPQNPAFGIKENCTVIQKKLP